MVSIKDLKKFSFLIYGLGKTGQSVVKFFKRKNIKNYEVWDDINKDLYIKKRPKSINKSLNKVDFIILSPGVSLKKIRKKNNLVRFQNKIITDIDLFFLSKNFLKCIVVTGTNGKSTTCKIISHILRYNGYKVSLGGNIGTPVLDLKISKKHFIVIEASSFQLAHSKIIKPDYALLLNISNDHLDWHGNMKNYINSKFKIFQNQKASQFSFLNEKFKTEFKKKNFNGKLIIPKLKNYKKLKGNINNSFIASDINDENMSFIAELTKKFNIKEKLFINSLKSFKGLPHRYEIFLKKGKYVFVNDSKATSFQATKGALRNTKNIYWILGGLPKKKDKINLKGLKKNIIKAYLIGKNMNFFRKQIKNKIKYNLSKTLKSALVQILHDTKNSHEENSTILFSPASASYDQYLNFEKRGEEFKRLSKIYARKLI